MTFIRGNNSYIYCSTCPWRGDTQFPLLTLRHSKTKLKNLLLAQSSKQVHVSAYHEPNKRKSGSPWREGLGVTD